MPDARERDRQNGLHWQQQHSSYAPSGTSSSYGPGSYTGPQKPQPSSSNYGATRTSPYVGERDFKSKEKRPSNNHAHG